MDAAAFSLSLNEQAYCSVRAICQEDCSDIVIQAMKALADSKRLYIELAQYKQKYEETSAELKQCQADLLAMADSKVGAIEQILQVLPQNKQAEPSAKPVRYSAKAFSEWAIKQTLFDLDQSMVLFERIFNYFTLGAKHWFNKKDAKSPNKFADYECFRAFSVKSVEEAGKLFAEFIELCGQTPPASFSSKLDKWLNNAKFMEAASKAKLAGDINKSAMLMYAASQGRTFSDAIAAIEAKPAQARPELSYLQADWEMPSDAIKAELMAKLLAEEAQDIKLFEANIAKEELDISAFKQDALDD